MSTPKGKQGKKKRKLCLRLQEIVTNFGLERKNVINNPISTHKYLAIVPDISWIKKKESNRLQMYAQ
jgi:hypothetical protein